MVIFGVTDHVGRVLFTVCVDDHQPPPKTFFDPGKTLSVRITTWFSVIKQLSSVKLANDKIFLLVGENFIKVTEIKAWSSSALFWLSYKQTNKQQIITL